MCLIKKALKFYTKIYFKTQEIAFAAKKQKAEMDDVTLGWA